MRQEKFIENIVNRRLESISSSLIRKNNEYASVGDVFEAFKAGTHFSLHTTKEAVAWEFMVKHLQSIQQIVSNYENNKKLPDILLLDEKFGDAINYLILLEGMLKENIETFYKEEDPRIDKIKYNYISR